jgi:hypothetical protein
MDDNDGWPVLKGFLDGTPEGTAVEFVTMGGVALAKRMSFPELGPVLSAEGITGLLGMFNRPGVVYLQRYLELNHFPPFTPANELYRCFILRWFDMPWALSVFPRASIDGGVLLAALERAGLRGRNRVPVAHVHNPGPLVEGTTPAGEAELFGMGFTEPDLPFQNVLLLENLPGHLVYRNAKAAMDRGGEMLEAVEREWQARR